MLLLAGMVCIVVSLAVMVALVLFPTPAPIEVVVPLSDRITE